MARAKKIQKTIKQFRKRAKRRDLNLTTAEVIKKIERRFQVVELRKNGYSTKEIADTLNVDQVTVCRDLRHVLDETIKEYTETTEQSRQLQLMRLDQLLKVYTSYATETHMEVRVHPITHQEVIVEVPPNPKYAELILQVEARRAKLLALDVPEIKKLEHSGIREYVGVDVDQV